jgi:hypothetical protein
MIQIKIDDRKFQQTLRKLTDFPKEWGKAGAEAINRSLVAGRTAMSVEARTKYNVDAGSVKERIEVTRAVPSPTPTGTLLVTGEPIRLEEGGPFNVTVAGVKAPVVRTTIIKGQRKVVQGAFIGPRGRVLKRVGAARYPLTGPHTVSVPQMVGSEDVLPNIVARVEEVLNARIKHNILRALDRIG